MTGKPIDLYTRLGDGHVLITENLPGHWIVTWLPPEGHPGWPGTTFSSSTTPDMPEDGGADGLLEWARAQPWARPTA